ncbi:MAG: hypothetical protein V2A77_07020 [Pseudomonadota bacterium]
MPQIDKEFLARMKQEVEGRLAQKEYESVEYWLARVTEIHDRRHSSLAALQVDLRTLQEKMRNRLKAIKSER